MSDFNLSDKRLSFDKYEDCYHEVDIIEFIKRLEINLVKRYKKKVEMARLGNKFPASYWIGHEINKLAGEKLI